jgi:hypothetical protein
MTAEKICKKNPADRAKEGLQKRNLKRHFE